MIDNSKLGSPVAFSPWNNVLSGDTSVICCSWAVCWLNLSKTSNDATNVALKFNMFWEDKAFAGIYWWDWMVK